MNRLRRLIGEGRGLLGTIRARLTLWYVGLLALILISFSGFLYVSLANRLNAELDRSLAADAQRLTATLDAENGLPGFGGADNLPAGTVAAIYDLTGQQLLATDARQPLPAAVQALARATPGQSSIETVHASDGTDWRVDTGPVVENGRLIGVLQVAQSLQGVEAALAQLLLLSAVAIPLTLLLAVAGGVFLAGRALDPIDRITRTAEQIGAEGLSRRLGLPASDDEVGRLAITFDRMLGRLEAAFERQRQFIADASHELSTPLALLLSQVDLALERSRSSAEYRRVLISLRDDARRARQLLGDLLTLARADAGQEPLGREVLDLDSLALEVVSALQPLAEAAGVQLVCGATGMVSVKGDQTRLTQLVVNLTDNAIKYTPAGGMVTIAVSARGDRAILTVADTGIGIAPEHLPRLFERFYRIDAARSRSTGGTGLGLAISQWVAQVHHGEITVASSPGEGTTFTVSLPLVAGSGPTVRPRSAWSPPAGAPVTRP